MNELTIIKNDQAVTSSLIVAEQFGKRHDHVLRDIDNLIKNKTLAKEDVKSSTYIHKQNKQEYRQYLFNESVIEKIKAYYFFRKPMAKSDKVYVLKHIGFEGFYKIGITNDTNKRIEQLSTGSPLGVERIAEFQNKDAKKTESLIHDKFNEQRRNGEWFELTKEQLSMALKLIGSEAL
jgi:Rha family phage regulatory protein